MISSDFHIIIAERELTKFKQRHVASVHLASTVEGLGLRCRVWELSRGCRVEGRELKVYTVDDRNPALPHNKEYTILPIV